MISKDLSVALYNSIREENKERVFEHWHASSIAMCPRAHYFKRLGVSELSEPTGAKVLRWSAGHYLERGIRPHIEKLYKGVGSNERMTSKKLDLTGEFDNYAEEEETLIEIKSVSDWAFWEEGNQLGLKEEKGTKAGRYGKPVKNFVLKTSPYLHHELQQECYRLLLKELGKEVKAIHYVYISLNGRIVVMTTEPRDDVKRNVAKRLEILNKAWETKTPPECICKESHPLWGGVMQWCPYRTETGCCSLKLAEQKDD